MRLTYRFEFTKNSEIQAVEDKVIELYNQANYYMRQSFFDKSFVSSYKVRPLIKEKHLELFKSIDAHVVNQTLMLLGKNWKSYFNSMASYREDPSKFTGEPSIPRYKKYGATCPIIYDYQCCSIKDNILKLPKSPSLLIPQKLEYDKFCLARIIPTKTNRWICEIVYEVRTQDVRASTENYASIDLGIDNFATLVSKEHAILFDGKVIKSINQGFNKFSSKLSAIKDKGGKKRQGLNSMKLAKLSVYREKRLRDYLHKVSRKIVNYCAVNDIGNLVIGYNKGWKDSIALGKRTNQKFVYIPYSKFLALLKYKCELAGIAFTETEESYTSKVDFLALESLCKHEQYSGKRVRRGLFQSSTGKLINADVNGACNILRKVVGDSVFIKRLAISRSMLRPVRIRQSDLQTSNAFFIKNLNKF